MTHDEQAESGNGSLEADDDDKAIFGVLLLDDDDEATLGVLLLDDDDEDEHGVEADDEDDDDMTLGVLLLDDDGEETLLLDEDDEEDNAEAEEDRLHCVNREPETLVLESACGQSSPFRYDGEGVGFDTALQANGVKSEPCSTVS